MAISVSFMWAAKALASLLSRYADSERAGESAHLHSLSLHNSNFIWCAGSNGDLRAIYANSEGSGQCAQLDLFD